LQLIQDTIVGFKNLILNDVTKLRLK
jgi:hypothetical protein